MVKVEQTNLASRGGDLQHTFEQVGLGDAGRRHCVLCWYLRVISVFVDVDVN